jgi:L-asparaginase/Glu-tRNA(Gln) amidotransferase subunit D
MNINTLDLCIKNSKAVVISGYGMGNLPTSNAHLMEVLDRGNKAGVIICVKT